MARRLFCEISPFTYKLSTMKCIVMRKAKNAFSGVKFARTKSTDPLPVTVYEHKSLIRRRLGSVNMTLQENKAVNLSLAAPRISGILIRQGETFSFWRLVGNTTAGKGYREGLTVPRGKPSSGIGGGMCQMSNLIHWMALHSELEITEHHHHDGLDLFPDFNRQIPFGTGTSVLYNYLDYRLKNNTDNTYQLLLHTDDEYLCGELRAQQPLAHSYRIEAENEHFVRENGTVYRCGEVYRITVDVSTGSTVKKELIRTNHAKVMYDTNGLEITDSKEMRL